MITQKLDTSVIIIGAGPAGAGASFFLTKYAIPHIVIDKDVFPRDKVCGDACSGKTALVINRANPDWLHEIFKTKAKFMPSWGIKFVAPNGKGLDIPFMAKRTKSAHAPGFTVPRLDLDNFLFNKMASPYCTIFQGAKVNGLYNASGSVSANIVHEGINYIIAAPAIVGADGDKSMVRSKFLSVPVSPKSSAVGLRAYYEGVTDMHNENFIELHFLPEMLPGYLWIFPLPDGKANVGVGMLSDVVRKRKINLRDQMMSAIQNNPKIAPRFANATLLGKVQGWGLPMAMKRLPVSGDRYVLTGDAASLIDPFSGEGIGNALYSGMLAADALKEALAKEDFSAAFFKTAYDDVLYKRLGDELKISATLQKLCRFPWLFNFVVNKAHKSEVLRHTISSMFTDMDLRQELRKPSFYLKILMNK